MVHVSKFEMRGFKSFGHKKVTLPLSSGLTAIVGPNGSGKSNVVDALSFALGQMSAKTLRTRKFSELIYHGGEGEDSKKPAPFAKVTVHLENDDGTLPIDSKQVKVSRKVKRNGQSTYRLNGNRSSRHEIMEIISQGISSSEGHNFVMQGDVDQLIKMSSTDRREIIDDLAGVAEFDEKKTKALSQLEKVDTNLQSQEGALKELEQRIEELASEKEDALKYRKLSSDLKEKKSAAAFLEVKSCGEKRDEIQGKIEKKNQRLEKLEERKKKAEAKREKYQEQLKENKKVLSEKEQSEAVSLADKAYSRVETLKEQLDESRSDFEELGNKISSLKSEIKEVAEKAQEKSLLSQVRGLLTKFRELREEFNELLAKLDSKEPFEEVLPQLKEVLKKLGSAADELDEQFEEVLGSREEFMEIASETGEIKEAGSKLQKLRSKFTALKTRRSEFKKRIDDLNQKIGESKEELEEAEERAKQVKESIRELRERVSELSEKAGGQEDKSKKTQEKIDSLRETREELRVKEAKVETELKEAEKKREKYDVEIKRTPRTPIKKLRSQIKKLERKIEKLKPINERAIESYKEVKKRYDSQSGRYDKLMNEKQTLLEFMEEIDRKKAEVFMETFEEIAENFSEVFSELSPEGSGRLFLENPEEPFEGGLEIEARPAGKKLLNINSLSGGEKALTALSFIFAIQRTKPSALYVLDEIDAHLDPENEKRVAKMLKRSSEESQIVVITLRDAMMAVADRLFGVHMDKSNISHLVSVDLEELA